MEAGLFSLLAKFGLRLQWKLILVWENELHNSISSCVALELLRLCCSNECANSTSLWSECIHFLTKPQIVCACELALFGVL